jgi:hypothetical protein
MIPRSIFITSLLSLCIAAPLAAIGCAAPTDSTNPSSNEPVAESQDDLSGVSAQLVGSFWTHRPAKAGFARLELKSNGKYTAEVDPDGKIMCVTSPCLLPESGTWSATSAAGGGFHLRIHPTGQPVRAYDATKNGGANAGLTLHRSGVTETLYKLAANACLDNNDCKSNEECAPRLCLMFCAFNDPFCCGPSTCHVKTPAPKLCGGIAGIACGPNEVCVDDPSDNCDPSKGGADCDGICQPKPTGTPCGPNTCGAGKVCCNALAGICTNPGEVCIQ